MTTRIYGASEDLIEFLGGVSGEVSCCGTDEQPHGVLVICDDGTVLEVKYGKGGQGIWAVMLLRAGRLFDRIVTCEDEEADPYSDVAHFRDGLKWAWAATQWETVRTLMDTIRGADAMPDRDPETLELRCRRAAGEPMKRPSTLASKGDTVRNVHTGETAEVVRIEEVAGAKGGRVFVLFGETRYDVPSMEHWVVIR